MRAYAPEGMPPRGELKGVITDSDGWAVPRAQVVLEDVDGKRLASVQTRKDGKYAIAWEQPCSQCKLTAEREGFETQLRSVDFNGTNPLWFSFALNRVPPTETSVPNP